MPEDRKELLIAMLESLFVTETVCVCLLVSFLALM